MKRTLPWIAGFLLLAAVVAVGLIQASDDSEQPSESASEFDLDAARARLAGAPAPLAALHEQSARLLEGGVPAFEKRLAALRGTPVVINKWASWCGPCRAEFPHFQKLSRSLGKRVAFIGIDSMDNNDDARKFLKRYPISYPSYIDPSGKVAQVFNGVGPLPKTVFYDKRGKLAFVHVGQYRDEASLRRDIKRYAGG